MPLPSFEEFYSELHGRQPFPWQRRLAELVVSHGWPRQIAVPTGLGKTSSIDIAVWALAAQADRHPADRTAATRVWYVVNRRLLVDAASDHAAELAKELSAATRGPLAEVAKYLRSIEGGLTNRPLQVSRMRGGSTLDSRPVHLAQPAVICATVPMFASRLLFRAYGASTRMWPIDAALAGVDSLVLLDEAHLALPLERLVLDLPECDIARSGMLRAPGGHQPSPGPRLLVGEHRAYPMLVSLTATGVDHHDRFDLDSDDLAHPEVARRLDAPKPTQLVEVKDKDKVDVLVSETHRLLQEARHDESILVFANSPSTARRIAAGLRDRLPEEAQLVVLTGQLRANDAENVRRQLLDPATGMPNSDHVSRRGRLVVVATQTLEVGADLDADALVTESAGVRAMIQRFGRLNRRGTKPNPRAVIVHPTDPRSRLYGEEPDKVADRLGRAGRSLNLCPREITQVLGAPSDTPLSLPALLPTHLWEWSKTSTPVKDAAPIELFYNGFEEPDRMVSLAWREYLPPAGEQMFPSLHHSEWVDVRIAEARSFVEAHPDLVRALSPDGASAVEITPRFLRPGMRLVAHVTAGGYGAHGWDPGEPGPVKDLSPELTGAVLLEADALRRWLGTELPADLIEVTQPTADGADLVDPEQLAAAAEAIAAHIRQLKGLALRSPALEFVGSDGATLFLEWHVETDDARPPAVDALDELSIAPTAALHDHLDHVGRVARQVADAAGLSPNLAKAVESAGRYHDLGKADPRFQLWLGRVADGPLRAKSNVSRARWQRLRQSSGWPDGARHELLSVQLLDAATVDGLVDLEDADLVRHLVIAHHGHGRPLVAAASGTQLAVSTTVEVAGGPVTATTDPGSIDWDQPRRFRDLSERFGAWGLAWLETLVRQADHLVSSATEVE